MYVVTTQQMQAAEQAANAAGQAYDQLMENAGRAVAEAMQFRFELAGKTVLVLVGPGNNGGDGLVAARHLARRGALVTLYIWRRQLDADPNWARLVGQQRHSLFQSDDPDFSQLTSRLASVDFIVDALLGTGVSRPIEGSLAQLLDQVKMVVAARRQGQASYPLLEPSRPQAQPPLFPQVVAVDLPSGLNSDTGQIDPHTLPADVTVTFGAVKLGQILNPNPDSLGRLLVADIGLRPEHFPAGVATQLATAPTVAAWLPPRPANANKGTFGKALLVAGSVNYTGAALLAGQAATRVGPGLVTLAPPQTIYPILAARLAEATYLPLADEAGAFAPAATSLLKEKFSEYEAALIGPGLSLAGRVSEFLMALLAEAKTFPALVWDADALNILAKQPEWWRWLPPQGILTPHPGEMARLTGDTISSVQQARLTLALEMAARWQQVVLLKGAYTVIAGPDGRSMVLPFANPALAKAGSGDVLAGSIVGLLAQGMAPFAAAVAGAYLHGVAGELARERLGVTAVVAGDLVERLPAAIRLVAGS